MDGHVTTELGAQRPCQGDRIPFDEEIQICDGSTKNGIPQRTPHDVDRHTQSRGLPRDGEKELKLIGREPVPQQSSKVGLHWVIVMDEIVYNPVDVAEPAAVPAWLNPYLVWIGLVLRIQRGSRTR